MANEPNGARRTNALLLILAALALAAVVLWQLGVFGGKEEQGRTVYKADVTDKSGGELIVTDQGSPAVEDVHLPETPMTNVPPSEEASPTPNATAE